MKGNEEVTTLTGWGGKRGSSRTRLREKGVRGMLVGWLTGNLVVGGEVRKKNWWESDGWWLGWDRLKSLSCRRWGKRARNGGLKGCRTERKTEWKEEWRRLIQGFPREERKEKKKKKKEKDVLAKKKKLATVVESDPKAPFLIATTPWCRGGHYSFPRISPLYP